MLSGVRGAPIEVEVRISSQLPRVDVVGLPEAAVRESVSRIRGAIAAAGMSFPDRRVTVNLAPAELRKTGAGLDLPIAIGVLAASGQLPTECLEGRAFIGELALDGRLRPTRGSLAAVIAARELDVREALVARESAPRACYAPGIRVLGASDLPAVLAHLLGDTPLRCFTPEASPSRSESVAEAGRDAPCLSEVRGQTLAKRALEIAAAGGHGLLMIGPPGTGKTLLARRLPGLLPSLGKHERLESLCVLDASDLLPDDAPVPHDAPFRAPHHSASAAGLLGGGRPIRPGEVSLAHRGVLFLDELPEFDRRCLESLREVLEQGIVRIARAQDRLELPASFQLIAAANPCPCGDYGQPDRDCRCDDAMLARYRRRLSGPLLDRIDLCVQVGPVPWSVLREPPCSETSDDVRKRVVAARALARARGVPSNAAMKDAQLDACVDADEPALDLLGRAVDRMKLSARAARRVLRVARTLADLQATPRTRASHVAEALSMRNAPDA